MAPCPIGKTSTPHDQHPRTGRRATPSRPPPTPHPRRPAPTFADFDVHPDIVEALAAVGIIHPFPIQAMTLPVALAGHDIIGQAKTGTGKTLGFGVPLLQRAVGPKDAAFATLATRRQAAGPRRSSPPVSWPCRSPATSSAAGKTRGVRVLTVYGGRAYEPQVEALQRGVEIVVGTPGRLIDLAKQGHLDLSRTSRASSSTRPTRCSTWASCPTSRSCWR